MAVPSLNDYNLINLWGHYIHDEHRSPYASHLYDKPKDFLDEQQTKFLQKMEQFGYLIKKHCIQLTGLQNFINLNYFRKYYADIINYYPN